MSRSRPLVEAWLDRLLTEESAVQRRAMQLLAVAQLAEAIGPWQVWEAASAPKLSRAMAFVGRDSATREELDNYSRLLDGVQKVKAAAPTSVQIEEALRNVMTLASSTELTALHAPMRRFLGAQPAGLGPHWRAKLFAHLAKLAAALPSPRLGWLWDELAAALEAGAPLAMLDPWRAVVASQWGSFLDQEMTVHARTRAQVRRVVQALVELARRGPVSACDLVELSEWLEVGLDVELVPELTARMRVAELRATPGNGLRQAALALVGPDLDALVATMAELAKLTGETTWLEQKQLRELLLRAVDAGAGWLLRAAFAAEQGGRVTALAASLGALPPKRWPMPPGDEAPAWIARYPEALAPALERLASVDAAAAATAKKKLAQDLPDPDDLRREIAALRERAPLAPSLAARLANLEARLATPPRPSPARLATLAQKLEQTAAAVGLERLSAAAFAEATARLLRTFGLSGWPDSWPTDRKTLQAVQALLALEPADRQLAARLLQARTGPPPWDLRDEPANLRFLERMRARGLSLERWFDDTPQRIIEMDEPLELALCADPLEVFQMGGHFQTCLSPGDINFFSVVANAADVNKRVLYARAPDGRVIGRCLLGLTDSGGLLVFHPYCHTSIDFFAVVSRFATELAAQLGTEVVPRGTLSTILARDWYDDGARDLTGRFAALRDPDNLDLTTIEPAALPARLALLLGRPLDDLTLPFVLDLPGLTRRPGLLASLAPALLACTTPRTRVEGAVLAMEVEARALADRLLGDFADTIELGGHSWREGAVLAQLRPSLTLARLRATRRRGVRSWRQESGARLLLAGMALEGLRRPRQAATMYRLALDADGHLRDVARGHLERIEHALAEAGGV